jgi:invasion protein IalB
VTRSKLSVILVAAGLLSAGVAAGLATFGLAADVAPKSVVYKQWTLTCATPAPAAGSTTKPQTYCLIHHEVHPDTDKTKTILIATTRYIGKDRTLAMILRLPPVANLQKGVVFSVDKNPAYKAKISSCTQALCFSQFQISDDVLKQLKAGTQMSVAFVPTTGQQQPIKLALPLEGYGPAFDALQKTGH